MCSYVTNTHSFWNIINSEDTKSVHIISTTFIVQNHWQTEVMYTVSAE